MAVKSWHPGKLVLFWLIAGVVSWLAYSYLVDDVTYVVDDGNIVQEFTSPGRVLVLLVAWMVGPIITAIVLTWRWFSAREKND